MQLKEVQLLGILAVVAAGIILVCMWAGSDTEGNPAFARKPDQDSKEHTSSQVADLNELWQTLKRTETQPSATKGVEGAAGDIDAQSTVPAAGAATGNEASPQKDEQINDVLDKTDPGDIPLYDDNETPEKAPEPLIHIVQKGETLSGISRKYYKTSAKWRLIQEANKDLIKDPRRDLRPNMKLVIPALKDGKQTAARRTDDVVKRLAIRGPSEGTKIYEAQKGDTLWKIALKHYQDSRAWKDILEANSDILKAPEDLRPGMKLILP